MTWLVTAADAAASTAHVDRQFDQGFTLQGTSILLGLVVAVLTILSTMRKTRRENEADARARTDELKGEIKTHNDSVEKRLGYVESKIVDFMPRREIEEKIHHEKGNRTQADNALKERLDANTRDIVDIKVSVGRLDQKQDGLANDMGELKALVRDFAREVNTKLDKQQECLNTISRKA